MPASLDLLFRYMGVEARPHSLSRQNSDEDAHASVAAASSVLRLRRSNGNSDGEQGKALAEAVHARGSSDGNDRVGEGTGERTDAAAQSWFQHLDDTFLSPLFRISAVERERQGSIVESFQSECSFAAGSHQG